MKGEYIKLTAEVKGVIGDDPELCERLLEVCGRAARQEQLLLEK